MKHLNRLTAIFACSIMLLSGCSKESENAVTPNTTNEQSAQVASSSLERINQLRASLPAGVEDQLKERSALLIQTDPQYRAKVRSLMAIEPSACDDNTLVNQWLTQQLKGWSGDAINYAVGYYLLDLPTYDALVFENSSSNQTFGANGEYTQQLTKTFKDLQRFWNIQSSDIVLAAMHGNMLTNRERVARTYVAAYGFKPAVANILADIVLELTKMFPQYRNGQHPIFTFNAFAQQGFSYPPYGNIPDKIIMGDGILEAFTAVGYGDVAPQAVLAHEFGHQVQFQLNLFGEVQSPEATRRTELMADAYSAYYLSHARGASMQWKRVQQFLQVFFNIGDCSITSDGHHGTPPQRMAAAQWGYNLANEAQKQGKILSSQEFARLFEAELPVLVRK